VPRRSTPSLERMRAIATPIAFLGPLVLGACTTISAPHIPVGTWTLDICRSEGYTSIQPCAHLDQRLVLRVANLTKASEDQGRYLFYQVVPQALALKIYASTLSVIHAFPSCKGPDVLDGTLFSVKLITGENSATIQCGGAGISSMSPQVQSLDRLLKGATHAF